MTKVELKKWSALFCCILFVVLSVVITTEYFDSANYIVNFFIKPFYIYIPLFFFLISIILYCINRIFINDRLVKRIALFLMSFSLIYFVLVNSILTVGKNRSSVIEKANNITNNFNINNLPVNSGDFELNDDNMLSNNHFYLSFGNVFLYNSDYNYSSQSENNSSDIETYYFENYPKMLKKQLLSKIEKREFYNNLVTDTEIKSRDIVEGSFNGVNYKYCNKIVKQGPYVNVKYYSYFATIIESENKILFISMRSYYDYITFDPKAIIECAIHNQMM